MQLTALTVSVKVTETGDIISGTVPSTVTINAGETTATLTVATDNDEADESNSVVTAGDCKAEQAIQWGVHLRRA